ncbi:hypothetical protein PFISCL1PPCAC_1627 [Pristionchus fissidentatus]|uniref:Ribosomal protein n=1 Tax=Pristionchus fissidentatus TaxID=1538716 RepID=A0AAV5UT11_9BILA|nr:hypothetical protein PFISCL1PPCAC_1624 [Pristionchus fissidentatus]GMT10330.1 hypothetical protein PFISCL1PPCAC_1627 [Pristionchus fissidentatus]
MEGRRVVDTSGRFSIIEWRRGQNESVLAFNVFSHRRLRRRCRIGGRPASNGRFTRIPSGQHFNTPLTYGSTPPTNTGITSSGH